MLHYLDKKVEPSEIWTIEHHISDCDFCSDAFDGLAMLSKDEREKITFELETCIDAKIASLHPPQGKTLQAIPGKKNPYRFWAAAGILFLMLSSAALLYSYYLNTNHSIVSKNDKESTDNKNSKSDAATLSSPELSTIEISDSAFANNDLEKKKESLHDLDKNKFVTKNLKMEENSPMPNQGTVASTSSSQGIEKESEKAPEQIVTNTTAPQEDTKNDNNLIAKKDDEVAPSRDQAMNTYSIPQSKGKMEDVSLKETSRLSKKSIETDKTDVGYGYEKKSINSLGENADFQKGLEAFKNQNYNQSIIHFTEALRTYDGDNKDEIKYNLALAYQRNGNIQLAQNLYKELEKSSWKYKSKARRALYQMSK